MCSDQNKSNLLVTKNIHALLTVTVPFGDQSKALIVVQIYYFVLKDLFSRHACTKVSFLVDHSKKYVSLYV